MNVKSVIIAGAALFAAGTTHAAPCDPGQRMTFLQIIGNVTNNKYTCVGVSPNASWNEKLSGGSVTDYKLGPTDPIDPSVPVGTVAVSGANDNNVGGVITYNYLVGGSFAYWIDTGTGSGTLGTSPFVFCPTGGGANITVNVQPGPC